MGLLQSPEVQVILDWVRLGKIIVRVLFGQSSEESRFVYGEIGRGNDGKGLGSIRRLLFVAAAKIVTPKCVYSELTVKTTQSLQQHI